MSNNETIHLKTEHTNYIFYHSLNQHSTMSYLENQENLNSAMSVMDIPTCDLTRRKSRQLYKHVEATIKNFDHTFDNTVVDSYAFDTVLQSDEFINAIYYYLYDSSYSLDEDLDYIKEQLYAYTLHRVKEIYDLNNHKLLNPITYYHYIDKLLSRIEPDSLNKKQQYH